MIFNIRGEGEGEGLTPSPSAQAVDLISVTSRMSEIVASSNETNDFFS